MSLTDAYVIKSTSEDRVKNDFYPTAPIATLSLLKNHNLPHTLWEPAAGKGHISKELIRNGYEVISTDLYGYVNPLVHVDMGVDFLKCDRLDVDGVITNPPFGYNLPEKLVYKMLDVHEYKFLALFVRLTFLESARRYELFKKFPPTNVYALSGRVHCDEKYFGKEKGLGGMVGYAWFVWDYRNVTIKDVVTRLEWIRPSDYVGDLE